ncbi:MAG: guanylate kinase [Mycoplasmoidaceae bacterium]
METRGTLIIFSGPSGVGKNTVIDKIIYREKVDLYINISMTTRIKRPHEIDGVDYYFVTKKIFEENIANNQLLEWAEFAGNFYGSPIKQINDAIENGKNVVLEIEVQGALQVMEKLKSFKYLSIFLVPPSIEELKKRLELRNTETNEMILARLEKAKKELEISALYEHVIINDDPDHAAIIIEKIIINHLRSKNETDL